MSEGGLDTTTLMVMISSAGVVVTSLGVAVGIGVKLYLRIDERLSALGAAIERINSHDREIRDVKEAIKEQGERIHGLEIA